MNDLKQVPNFLTYVKYFQIVNKEKQQITQILP